MYDQDFPDIRKFPSKSVRYFMNIQIWWNLCRWMKAYLDVTENKKNIESANQIALEIRKRYLKNRFDGFLQEYLLINFLQK